MIDTPVNKKVLPIMAHLKNYAYICSCSLTDVRSAWWRVFVGGFDVYEKALMALFLLFHVNATVLYQMT